MTLRLILMRHAKSAWSDPTLDDHDRPLNARGRTAAQALGHWMVQEGYCPDLVLCSSARRARQTWEGIAPALASPPKVQILPAMYHAGPERLRKLLRGANGASVLMVAHNPGIAMFAEEMAQHPPDHDDFLRYPTGATTVLDFEADTWAAVKTETGRPTVFVTPRGLP